MNITRRSLLAAGLAGAAGLGVRRAALAGPRTNAEPKPEVAAILKRSTAVYHAFNSYRHAAVRDTAGQGENGPVKFSRRFVLALERPNKFAYRADTEQAETAAAVCNGKTFVNYRGLLNQYIQIPAPQTYTQINIVDDVLFEPLATYLIALMLQGDPLADKDVRAAFHGATLGPPVIEKGRHWQVVRVPFQGDPPYEFYFDADTHQLGRAAQKATSRGVKVQIVETIGEVSINKSIEASVFEVSVPAGVQKVDRFTTPLNSRAKDT